jgi:small conductance mechanosensitive channel
LAAFGGPTMRSAEAMLLLDSYCETSYNPAGVGRRTQRGQTMEDAIVKMKEFLALYGLRVIGALIIFLVGRWVAQFLRRLIRRLLTKRAIDATLVSFVGNMTYVGLMAFIIIAALSQIGVETASLIAVVGAAGLAVGLALQGSLANFAAGVLLLIFRPFKVGDLVEIAGTLGVVEELQIFTTGLKTPDNRKVIVPNAKITGDTIVNYSAKQIRRVDLVVGVSYESDLRKTKAVLQDVLASDERILKEPAPTVGVVEFADSSVNLVVQPWTRVEHYWDVHFGVLQAIKERLDAEGIVIPFPQRDVHVYQEGRSVKE